MRAVLDAGFHLTQTQLTQRGELEGWFVGVYGPETARLNLALKEAQEERRRLQRLDWHLVAQAWQLRKGNN
jgi:hypothetical protein